MKSKCSIKAWRLLLLLLAGAWLPAPGFGINLGPPMVFDLEAPTQLEVGELFGIRYRYSDIDGLVDVRSHHVLFSDGTHYTHDAGGSGWFSRSDLWSFSTPGIHWVEVYVDDFAGSESNHLRQTIRVGRLPDLSVAPLQVDITHPVPNQPLSLTVLVRNDGAGDAAATTLAFYLSSDERIDPGSDTLLGTRPVEALRGGTESTEQLSTSAPGGEGNYWIGACVEAVSGETDTGNNCSGATPIDVTRARAPDLALAAPNVDPATPTPSQPLLLVVRVRNSGNAGADPGQVHFYLSDNAAIGSGDEEIGRHPLQALTAGSELFARLSVDAPATTGSYWLGACADTVRGESNASNNCSSGTQITVLPAIPPGQAARIAANDRQTALTILGGAGDVIVYTDSNGHRDWDKLVLNQALHGPAASGPADTWFDPKDRLLTVAAPSPAGLILYQRSAGGSWSMTNLTTELGSAATAIVRGLSHFITPDLARDFDDNPILDEHGNPIYPLPERDRNNVHIVGLDGVGDLVLYSQRRDRDGGRTYWAYTNITRESLLPTHQEVPAWTTDPIGYAAPWNGWSIAGLNSAGQIIAVWTAPDRNGVWATTNLSASYGTPPLAGGLSAYVNWGINLTGVLPDGHLGVTWWSAQLERERRAAGRSDYWAFTDLTRDAGGPSLRPDTVTNYTTPNWPSSNVAGITEGNELVVYWWAPNNGSQFGREWIVSHLSRDIPGAVVPVGPLSAIASADGSTSIIGLNGEGQVLRYFWSADTGWQYQNVSKAQQGGTATFGPRDDGRETRFGAAVFQVDTSSEPATTPLATVSFDRTSGRLSIRNGVGVRAYEIVLLHDAGIDQLQARDGGYITDPKDGGEQPLASFSWNGGGAPALGEVRLMRYDGTLVPVAIE